MQQAPAMQGQQQQDPSWRSQVRVQSCAGGVLCLCSKLIL
jgi:hypothetical protein